MREAGRNLSDVSESCDVNGYRLTNGGGAQTQRAINAIGSPCFRPARRGSRERVKAAHINFRNTIASGETNHVTRRGAPSSSPPSVVGASNRTAQPYPPLRDGLRGQYPGSFEAAHLARDGGFDGAIAADDTGEHYDLERAVQECLLSRGLT